MMLKSKLLMNHFVKLEEDEVYGEGSSKFHMMPSHLGSIILKNWENYESADKNNWRIKNEECLLSINSHLLGFKNKILGSSR